jgi:hypothetical protein
VWKWLIGENALAYFAKALFLSPKDFKHFAPGNIFSLTLLKKVLHFMFGCFLSKLRKRLCGLQIREYFE